MYQFEATVYEVGDEEQCHAYLWAGEDKTGEPLMTAHVRTASDPARSGSSHERILRAIRLVCLEIAQNLDDGLF